MDELEELCVPGMGTYVPRMNSYPTSEGPDLSVTCSDHGQDVAQGQFR
jgi:hypothetical protein